MTNLARQLERELNKSNAAVLIALQRALEDDADIAALRQIPDIIRGSTWKTPELRASAASLVASIIRELVTHTSHRGARVGRLPAC